MPLPSPLLSTSTSRSFSPFVGLPFFHACSPSFTPTRRLPSPPPPHVALDLNLSLSIHVPLMRSSFLRSLDYVHLESLQPFKNSRVLSRFNHTSLCTSSALHQRCSSKQSISIMEKPALLIFDFDHSLIDCNSDPWVVDYLGATEVMRSLRSVTSSWTDLMDRMMVELITLGNTISDIEHALEKIPLHPAMMRTIQEAYTRGWELHIVSDANMFFIQKVLAFYSLEKYFTKIYSNPAHIDEQGVLRIQPYHSSPAHVCPFCPTNMCKGLILDNIRMATRFRGQSVIYIGDGYGDYCPSLRLREGDHVLAREGYPLSRLLSENMNLVKAKVHFWKSALDIENQLFQLNESGGQASY